MRGGVRIVTLTMQPCAHIVTWLINQSDMGATFLRGLSKTVLVMIQEASPDKTAKY